MKYIAKYIYILLLVCTLAQLCLCQSLEDVGLLFIITSSVLMAVMYCLSIDFSSTYALSAFSLLGFCFTMELGPLVVKTALMTSVGSDLEVPIQTYTCFGAFQVTTIVSHWIYRNFWFCSRIRNEIHTLTSRYTPLFQPVSNIQIFTIGMVGFASLVLYQIFLKGESQYGDAGSKLIQGLSVFSVAPVMVLVLHFFDKTRRQATTYEVVAVIIYLFMLVFVAAAVNYRTIFSSAIVTLFLACLLATLQGRLKLTSKLALRIVMFCIFASPLYIFLTRIAIAMVIVRPERDYVHGFDLLMRTLDVAMDGNQIENYKNYDLEETTLGSQYYNETYLHNVFLNRFFPVKFADNMLYWTNNFNSFQINELWDITKSQIWTMFPSPILTAIGVNVDKDNLAFSMMDYVLKLDGNDFIAAYLTGSSISQGYIFFGWMSFVYWGLFFAFWSFPLIDSLFGGNLQRPAISLLGLMVVWNIFSNVIAQDSIQAVVGSNIRECAQTLVLYTAVFYLTRWVSFRLQHHVGRPMSLRREGPVGGPPPDWRRTRLLTRRPGMAAGSGAARTAPKAQL